MTKWQWRVIMALVRYVLEKENMLDAGDNEKAERVSERDREILLEAAVGYDDESEE